MYTHPCTCIPVFVDHEYHDTIPLAIHSCSRMGMWNEPTMVQGYEQHRVSGVACVHLKSNDGLL